MRFYIFSAALLLAACERVPSSEVRTGGIYADLEVVARGDGESSVGASLRVGGSLSNTYLDLVSGDRLTAHQGEDSSDMERHTFPLGPVSYTARFDTDAENTPFRIEFVREPHDEAEKECRGESAPNSFATLPAPFTLDGPSRDATFSRAGSDLEITWSPNGFRDPMSWRISGGCIESQSGEISGDPGRVAISRGTLRAIRGRESETCAIEVEIVRARGGAVDPAYGEGGRFSAKQVRSLSVKSAP